MQTFVFNDKLEQMETQLRVTKVAFKFSDYNNLWQFYKQVQPLNIKVRLSGKILICECRLTDIAIAAAKFGAIITFLES